MPHSFAFLSFPLVVVALFAPADDVKTLSDGSLAAFRGRPQLDPREEASFDAAARAAKQAEWDADLAAHWKVDGKEIVNDGAGVYLTTREDYRDFELWVDWKLSPLGDSGIYLKATPQIQIWDTTEKGGKWNLGADKGSGGLWNNERFDRFPSENRDRAFGEWNTFKITQVGARTSVESNGAVVVDHVVMENFFDRKKPLPVAGPIQFQTHGGETRFRDVKVKSLTADAANALLAAHDAAGFEPIFNGKDFTGWSGPTDGYEIVDGGIVRCRRGAGGTIFTAKEYGDFVARLEFRLPPGGNNGLAIRYPGSGDGAYDGMCEVQVLDDTAEKYASLAQWQYCGSAYGQVSAARGYLRPVGDWNFFEVTVRGSTIRVELNGSIITDADLAANTPLSGHAHEGRLRKSGHFGLCGHDDPVEYRNIKIRSLPAQ
jgi:Domain of Unknown Function (DUF1080)